MKNSNLWQGVLWDKLQTNYPQRKVSVSSAQKSPATFESLTGRLRDDNYPCTSGARVAREWLRYAAVFLLIFTLGVGNVWGTPTTVTFTFNTSAGLSALGIDEPSSNSSETQLDPDDTYTLIPVNMQITHGGSTNTRIWKSNKGVLDLRTYNSNSKHATITFSVSSSYYLTQIVISGGSSWSTNNGSYSSGTWTKANNAEPTSVTFTSSGNNNINTIAVTYETASAQTCV